MSPGDAPSASRTTDRSSSGRSRRQPPMFSPSRIRTVSASCDWRVDRVARNWRATRAAETRD
eukprot:7391166-Prymnesium_polylepis.1